MAVTFHEVCTKRQSDVSFWEGDIAQSLFQIYSVLSNISTQFTHYDLHDENVLFYHVGANNCVQLKYHLSASTVISFYTADIIKIIDYGRCFFYDSPTFHSAEILKHVCHSLDCTVPNEPKCGSDAGYYWLNKKPNKYFIQAHQKNESHDLRLLHYLRDFLKGSNANTAFLKNGSNASRIQSLLEQVVYENDYGTREIMDKKTPNKIYNVHDAFFVFQQWVQSSEFIRLNQQQYQSSIVLGTLDIWLDASRPMVWVPNI